MQKGRGLEVEPEKVYQMDFAKIYGLLVNKAVKKGRTQDEVDEVIRLSLIHISEPTRRSV